MYVTVDTYGMQDVLSEEQIFALAKQAGFDGVDFSLYRMDPSRTVLGEDFRERAARTKALLDQYGLICNQTHAPFGGNSYKTAFDPNHPERIEIIRAIEYASILGAHHIVIHGIKPPMGIDIVDFNVKYYQSFEPYAKQFGIMIAAENLMKGTLDHPKLLSGVLDRLDPEWFMGLIDLGHSNMAGVAPESFIRHLSPGRLQGLHVQDNNGETDQHLVPWLGNIQWDCVIDALAETGYPGDLSMEIPGFLKRYDPALLPDALAFAARVGHQLVARFEAKRGRAL